MKKRWIITAFAAMTGSALQAQPVYSLRDCIDAGLERNYSIRIARAEGQIAENNATIGNAGYLPSLDFTGEAGGTVYDYRNRTASGGIVTSTPGTTTETVDGGINLSWTVFDGMNIQAEYARLKELNLLGELSVRLAVEDLVAGIAAEYYNLIRQKTRLRNLHSTLDLSRERLRIVEAQYLLGTMSGLELQQARVYFNADSSNVVSQLQTVHASQVQLNQLMAAREVEQTTLTKDSTIVPDPSLDREWLWQNALSFNVSLAMAQSNRSVAELELKKARSRNYPYIRLNAGYGYNTTWSSASADDLQQRLGLNYGITVGMTIFDGKRRREQRNALIQVDNQQLRIENTELELRADMSNLWMAYRNNLDLWQLEKQNLVVAQATYTAAMDRYKLGDLAGIDLREAQNSLLDAEERLSIAEYSIKLCEISLLQLSGQILAEVYR